MASNHKKDIDQLFKSKLENHASEVPESVWTKIAAGLDQKTVEVAVVEPKGKKTHISWLLKIAAGLLLFGFVLWQVQPEEKVYLTKEGDTRGGQELLADKGEAQLPASEITTEVETPSEGLAEAENRPAPEKKVISRPAERIAYQVEKQVSENLERESAEEYAAVTKRTIEPSRPEEVVGLVSDGMQENEVPIALEYEALTESELTDLLAYELESPDLQPLNLDDTETVKGTSSMRERERPRILSGVLNFVANNLKLGENPVIAFDETEDGILQVDMDMKAVFGK